MCQAKGDVAPACECIEPVMSSCYTAAGVLLARQPGAGGAERRGHRPPGGAVCRGGSGRHSGKAPSFLQCTRPPHSLSSAGQAADPPLLWLTNPGVRALQGCYELYARSPTGLSYDVVHVDLQTGGFSPHPVYFFFWLRPEVLESIFMMHRLTGALCALCMLCTSAVRLAGCCSSRRFTAPPLPGAGSAAGAVHACAAVGLKA